MIRISNLSKSYGDLLAVNDLSLDIYQGEILGFLGPNGAGKTTTINMICGLIERDHGTIKWADEGNVSDTRSRLGICPQENVFWPKLTCEEQLIFIAEIYGMKQSIARRRSTELLHKLGLETKSRALASTLSGGMKRRLNLALALVHDPTLLVLDEPEAGLDPQSRLLVRQLIRDLAGDKTIILTTHNMDEADRLAHRVAIMDQGTLLMVDSPEKLKNSIGEGDLLEIHLDIQPDQQIEKMIFELSQGTREVKISESGLMIRGLDLIDAVPMISEKIRKHGFIIKEMKLRENTLEDVFIHLTGRKLRE